MHRFYIPPDLCQGDLVALPKAEAHHALHVLRLRNGDPVTVLDGAGTQLDGVLVDAHRDMGRVEVRGRTIARKPAAEITLLQALPKGKLIESIIEKATELGVSRIIPLITERVVSRFSPEEALEKAAKWQAVAVAAIKQCGAPWLPRVETPLSLAASLARRESFDLPLVGALHPDALHPGGCFRAYRQAHAGRGPGSVAIYIGPEGDFTPAELDQVRAAGAQPITLGPLVLRSETAAIYSLSVIRYELAADATP